MISIPRVRRELTSDLLGRHVYLFGPGAVPAELLRRLAEAGAQEGTVVLSEDATRLSVAALFRPHLTVGAVPLFSAIATRALVEAIGSGGLRATPVWPHEVTVDAQTVGRSLVETESNGDRTGYVALGADFDMHALEAASHSPIDWNVTVAAFVNALDDWARAYATRGPAVVRGAIRFLPRGPNAARSALAAV